MENSFWLPQTGWDNTLNTSLQRLYFQLPLYTLNQDLYNFPAYGIEEVQESWIYEYILAHKLVGRNASNLFKISQFYIH